MSFGGQTEANMSTTGTHQLMVSSSPVTSYLGEPPRVGTESVGIPTSSEGLYLLLKQTTWDDTWELKGDLLVEVLTSQREVVASTYLSVREYGVGPSLEAAIEDLLTSLSDYYESLESRSDRVGPPGAEDLALLRPLIGRKA